MLEAASRPRKSYKPNKADWLEGQWAGLAAADADEMREEATAVPPDAAARGRPGAVATRRPDFDLNPKIARQLEAKRQMIETGEGIDWATGEALAFGTPAAGRHAASACPARTASAAPSASATRC